LLKNRGDLVGAQVWLTRAAEAGSDYATNGLAEVQRKIDFSDHQLESLTFDTFGWPMVENGDGFRRWHSDGSSLGERFFDLAPAFDSWDVDELRAAMIAGQQFVESPTFRIEDVPAELQKYVPKELPEQVNLLHIELFEIPPAKCILMETRHRSHGSVHYSSAIMILFAECFWILTIEMEENADLVGEREGAVARSILDGATSDETLMGEVDPYDRLWDGFVPLEHDPLTRMRSSVVRLRGSIQLGRDLLELEPYAPE
jgi:hypothetical protein